MEAEKQILASCGRGGVVALIRAVAARWSAVEWLLFAARNRGVVLEGVPLVAALEQDKKLGEQIYANTREIFSINYSLLAQPQQALVRSLDLLSRRQSFPGYVNSMLFDWQDDQQILAVTAEGGSERLVLASRTRSNGTAINVTTLELRDCDASVSNSRTLVDAHPASPVRRYLATNRIRTNPVAVHPNLEKRYVVEETLTETIVWPHLFRGELLLVHDPRFLTIHAWAQKKKLFQIDFDNIEFDRERAGLDFEVRDFFVQSDGRRFFVEFQVSKKTSDHVEFWLVEIAGSARVLSVALIPFVWNSYPADDYFCVTCRFGNGSLGMFCSRWTESELRFVPLGSLLSPGYSHLSADDLIIACAEYITIVFQHAYPTTFQKSIVVYSLRRNQLCASVNCGVENSSIPLTGHFDVKFSESISRLSTDGVLLPAMQRIIVYHYLDKCLRFLDPETLASDAIFRLESCPSLRRSKGDDFVKDFHRVARDPFALLTRDTNSQCRLLTF